MSLRSWLTSGFLFFSFFSHATPMYWIAEKNNIQYLLFGTLHVGDKSMYPLPHEVTQFLEHSNGLILEADLSSTTSPTYPTDTLITQDVLTEQQKSQLKSIAHELQISFYRLSQQPPWAAAITIQMTQLARLGYTADYGVEQHLISLAQKNQIQILGLESLQSQVDMLSDQKDNGKELLTSSLDEWENSKNNSLCMIKSWKSGDRNNFDNLVEQAAMSKQLSHSLEVERNNDWTEKLITGHFLPTKPGKYVVAVGLLHLIGTENLVKQLTEQGFSIQEKGKREQADCEFLANK